MSKIKFYAANQEQCDVQMRKLCDDGRCWTVTEVFGQVRATPHATPANVPRTPASTSSDLETVYWHNGAWHKRRPATAAMERKQQAAADKAAGVSDGGNVDIAAWFRRQRKAHAKRRAKYGLE